MKQQHTTIIITGALKVGWPCYNLKPLIMRLNDSKYHAAYLVIVHKHKLEIIGPRLQHLQDWFRRSCKKLLCKKGYHVISLNSTHASNSVCPKTLCTPRTCKGTRVWWQRNTMEDDSTSKWNCHGAMYCWKPSFDTAFDLKVIAESTTSRGAAARFFD